MTEKLLEVMMYQLAYDDMGIYPAAVTEKGKTTKRTEWQDGWNAYGSALIKKVISLTKWFTELPPDKKEDVERLVIAGKLHVRSGGSDVSLWVLCNDLFFWGCADGEDFALDDLADFNRALDVSPDFGDLLWVCRKRGMRPQKPYYKHFSKAEKKLFDACGPKREE